MKKLLLIFASCVTCFAASSQALTPPVADAKARDLLGKLSERIAALGDYRVEFRADAEGGEVKGIYLVSGRKFRITTPDFDVIGDGAARYEINHGLEEVVVDNMDTTDINILSNPTRAFEFAAAGFIPTYGGQLAEGGRSLELLRLEPAFEGSAITSVELFIDRLSGLPARLSYGVEGLDGDVDIVIVKFESAVEIPQSDFRFDRSAYRGYEVVDFR